MTELTITEVIKQEEISQPPKPLTAFSPLSSWIRLLRAKNGTVTQLFNQIDEFNLPLEASNLLLLLSKDCSLKEFLNSFKNIIEKTEKSNKTDKTLTTKLPIISSEALNESFSGNMEIATVLQEVIAPDLIENLFPPITTQMFEHTRKKVSETLGELKVVTTHDNNLERQYREAISYCSKLESDLDRAKREVFKLRGRVNLAEMAPEHIRAENNRRRERDERRKHIDRELMSNREVAVINPNSESNTHRKNRGRNRRNVTLIHKKKLTVELPPPLEGCMCSVCQSVQGLGSIVLDAVKVPIGLNTVRSGQQVMLGDRIIVKRQKPGTIRYLGKVEYKSGPDNEIFAGVHLDHPSGTHNGTVNGRRYFECPDNHGIFLPISDIICVTSHASVPKNGSLAYKKAKLKKEEEEDARKKFLMTQELVLESELNKLKASEDRRKLRSSLINQKNTSIDVLQLYTPLNINNADKKEASMWSEEQTRQLQTMDFSQTPGQFKPDDSDPENNRMAARVNSLLEKSRNIYTGKQSIPHTIDSLPQITAASKGHTSTKSDTAFKRVTLNLAVTA